MIWNRTAKTNKTMVEQYFTTSNFNFRLLRLAEIIERMEYHGLPRSVDLEWGIGACIAQNGHQKAP
jgi:hypothetical protein